MHITQVIGQFGKWQLNIAAFYLVIYVLSPYNNFGISFHAPQVDHWCSDTRLSTNGHFDLANANDSYSVICNTCQNWTFDESHGVTIVSEFRLVCDRSWLPSFSQSVFQFGYIVNGLVLGYLSDRFGRRPVLWLAIGFEICGGLSVLLSQSMTQYIISRFFLGLGDSGRGVCLYLLVFETVGPKYRSDVIFLISFGSILGYTSLPAFAYLFKNFRYLQLLSTSVAIVLSITWLWSIPESPRWQLSNGKTDLAKTNIMRAAKMNNKVVDDIEDKIKILAESASKDRDRDVGQRHRTIVDLLRHKELRKYTTIFWFSFAVNAFIYHGISLNIEQIGGNLFVNFAIAGVVEIPSLILNIIGLKYMGRKYFTVWTMLLAALAYGSIVVLTAYDQSLGSLYQTLKLVFAMTGKLFIFSSFNAVYIHSGEIFPTVVRHTGIGSCTIAARLGSILAPYVKELSELSSFGVSTLVFGLLAAMASFLTLFLPETKDQEIPDQLRDVGLLDNCDREEEPLLH